MKILEIWNKIPRSDPQCNKPPLEFRCAMNVLFEENREEIYNLRENYSGIDITHISW